MTGLTGTTVLARRTTGWDQIIAGIRIALGGEREQGHRMLLACWNGTGEGDHAQRCALSYYLAGTEAVLADEVAWDERALAAFEHVRDSDLAVIGVPEAAALAPSLHLNLGNGYFRQGRLAQARTQLDAGLTEAVVLEDDWYGEMVRSGLECLADRICDARRDARETV